MFHLAWTGLLCVSLFTFSSCAVTAPVVDQIDPYGQGNSVEALGNRDSSAVSAASGGGSKEAKRARQALEVMGSYQRALPPSPAKPVIRPAEIRLMWIPDHLNGHGDLVPAHYYFLRVMPERWAVTDAYEVEQVLRNVGGSINSAVGGGGAAPVGGAPSTNYGTGGGGGSATPWVYKDAR